MKQHPEDVELRRLYGLDEDEPIPAVLYGVEKITEQVACCCESSLCDHDGECERPADSRLVMDYVVDTCTQCAANMCATGGAVFIHLAKDAP